MRGWRAHRAAMCIQPRLGSRMTQTLHAGYCHDGGGVSGGTGIGCGGSSIGIGASGSGSGVGGSGSGMGGICMLAEPRGTSLVARRLGISDQSVADRQCLA